MGKKLHKKNFKNKKKNKKKQKRNIMIINSDPDGNNEEIKKNKKIKKYFKKI